MLHTFTKFSLFLFFLLIGFSSHAVNYTWTGQVSTDWNTAGNWSPAGVPGALDGVTLDNSGKTVIRWPVLTADIYADAVRLDNSAEIDVAGHQINARATYADRASAINNSNSNDIIINCQYFGMGVLATMNGNTVITATNSIGVYGSHYKGNVKFILKGDGNFIIQDPEKPVKASVFEGNLEIERTISGLTEISYSSIYSGNYIVVKGNFKYTNLAGGYTYISFLQVQGKIDININGSPPVSDKFEIQNHCFLNLLSNKVAGGAIDVKNYQSFQLDGSNLRVDHFNATGLRNDVDLTIGEITKSTIEGNVNVQFNQVENQESYLRVQANNIIGNSNFVFNGYGGIGLSKYPYNRTNYFQGDVSVTHTGNGRFTFSDEDESKYEGNLMFDGDVTLYRSFEGDIYGYSKFRFVGEGDSNLEWRNTSNPILGNISIEKSGSGKLLFANPMQIIGNLALINGIAKSTTLNPLTFLDQSTVTGASDISHITGPVQKIGNDAFTFPIGSGTKLTPVTISAPSAATDEFSAEYVASPPTSSGYNTSSKAGSLTNVYNAGFWDVKRVAGNSNVSVSLGYNLPAGYITNQSKLRVAHWNGSTWEDLGNGGTSGSLTEGTVTTAGGVTSFSPFTIASADASNPLPVKLVKFSVRKENETALLQWSTTEEINSDRFEIENSLDALNWQKIGETKASGESTVLSDYQFVDKMPFAGLNYYRLKMIDKDETFSYSRIESIKLKSAAKTVMYPNPVSDRMFIETAKGLSITKVKLTNNHGTDVLAINAPGVNSGIDLSKLPAGVYFVNITLSDSRIETHKVFVKK
jgi:hypothetical protein